MKNCICVGHLTFLISFSSKSEETKNFPYWKKNGQKKSKNYVNDFSTVKK